MIIIALTEQIHLYSIDTSYFYKKEEESLNRSLNVRYFYMSKLKKRQDKLHRRIKKVKTINESGNKTDLFKFSTIDNMNLQLSEINKQLLILDNDVREMKKELRNLMKDNNNQRSLSLQKLKSRDIVSLFNSSLVRAMGAEISSLTRDIIIVKTFYYDVLKDIITQGFTMAGHEYVPFTASAGQIRTKKTVFIKKSVFDKIQMQLTCGLTIEEINAKGGINVNKYLAYLALSNSATEVWEDFDIDKSIVVDDMETNVLGMVDYIDRNDYSINRQEMEVPIPHTDGCGMMLTKIKDKDTKSMMVRLPWVKGLMVPFAFDSFIKQHNRVRSTKIGKIKDIYNKEYDLLEDDIQFIFTKSQFKMWKYYDSWEAYKSNYKKYRCEAGYCNKEPDAYNFGNAKLNYQMLQTLTDITEDELIQLSKKTVTNINQMGRDRKLMLKAMGVTNHNMNKNYYQQALEVYPEMLQDTYSRQTIKNVKSSMVKDAKSAKIELDALYTFLIPDMYAVAEFLLCGTKKPKGLLQDGEVSCRLFDNGRRLDCLRSPHLYREHAVRTNVVNKETKKWFKSNGIYTSSHDLISKMLQFDNDGDQALVVSDPLFVEIADRNMSANETRDEIVPLYYEMEGSIISEISRDTIHSSMTNAYSGGNIGTISNNITKIWNSDNPDLDMIKLLCFENNFVIDYAKTLFKPKRPAHIKKEITKYTKNKVPYFFMYAKDKKRHQVESKNNSTANRLIDLIPDNPIVFKNTNVGEFNYRFLKDNKNTRNLFKYYRIIKKYRELDLHKYFLINYHDDKEHNLEHVYQEIREKLLGVEDDASILVNVLVMYLYRFKDSDYKATLWECFGDVLVDSLKSNIDKPLDNGWIQCELCGERVEKKNNRTVYCSECYIKNNRVMSLNRYYVENTF